MIGARIRKAHRGLRILVRNMTAHHTLLVASGVAFTTVFGLIPAMIAVVSVYGLVASPADVESNMRPLVEALPPQAGDLLVGQLENVTALDPAGNTAGLVIGLVGVAWAVSTSINSLVMAIRIAHEVPSPHTWIQGRIFALRLSVVAVVATAAVIWLVVALPHFLDEVRIGDAYRRAVSIGRWPLVAIVSSTALALLYRAVVGHRTGRFHFVSVGAVIGTAVWILSTVAMNLAYELAGRIESTLGSLSAVAALLAWLYLTALSALIGAEVDGVRFERNGRTNGRDRADDPDPADDPAHDPADDPVTRHHHEPHGDVGHDPAA